MKIEVRLPKGNGLSIGNSLRQMAMSRLPAWRPIAISLNRKLNILHATDEIVEDVYSIMSAVTSLKYTQKKEISGDFIKERFSFVGSLRTSGLVSENFDIAGEDQSLITSLDDREVSLTIVYRFARGDMDQLSNSEFLKSQGERNEDYLVMNSRHTNVNNFSFDVLDLSLEDEKLLIDIQSDTEDERKILIESIKCLKEAVNSFSNIIESKDSSYYNEKEPPKTVTT